MSNLLHILQPKSYHEEASIVANREGLVALRTAIDKALAEGSNYTDGFFPLPYDSELIGNQVKQWAWLNNEEQNIIKTLLV